MTRLLRWRPRGEAQGSEVQNSSRTKEKKGGGGGKKKVPMNGDVGAGEVFRGQVSEILNTTLRFRFRGSRMVTQCFAHPPRPLFFAAKPRLLRIHDVSAEECLWK